MLSAAVFAMALLAAPTSGGCAPSPAQAAEDLSLNILDTKDERASKMLISATFLLQFGKADSAHARAAAEPCPLGPFKVNGSTWELAGGDRGYVRRAVSSDRSSPVVFVYPFSDLDSLISASKTHGPAPPTRYLLISSVGSVDTIWKAYMTLPSDAQFQADVANLVTSRISAVASVDLTTKKISLFVPKADH